MTSQQTNPDLASQIGQSGGTPAWLRTRSNQAAPTATIALVPMLTHWSVIYAIREMVTLPLQETQDEGAINSGGYQLGIQHARQQLDSNNDHVQPQVSNPTSHSFDPDEDDNTFVAQRVITESYPEQGQQDGDAQSAPCAKNLCG